MCMDRTIPENNLVGDAVLVKLPAGTKKKWKKFYQWLNSYNISSLRMVDFKDENLYKHLLTVNSKFEREMLALLLPTVVWYHLLQGCEQMCLFTPLSGRSYVWVFGIFMYPLHSWATEGVKGSWETIHSEIRMRGNSCEGSLPFYFSCYFFETDEKMRGVAQEIWSQNTVQCSNWRADKY